MHVVHVNYAYAPGTAVQDVVQAHRTLHRLAAAQASISDVASTVLQRFSADARFEVDGVRYVLFRARTRTATASIWSLHTRLHREASRIAPDILHVHGLLFPVQVMLLRRATGGSVPVVVQHHGGMPHRGWHGGLQRLLARCADGFLFNGAGNAQPWLQAGVIGAASRVYELPEASSDFTPGERGAARRALGLGDEPLVLWVARLNEGKDPLTALGGFEVAARAIPHARLVMIYRESPLRAQVDAWIARRPALAQRVLLLGPVDHERLAAWFRSADAFIAASRQEGSNYALIESQACGTPAVCTDIAPHRFIAGASGQTRFFPIGDTMACGEALVDLLRRPDAAARSTIRQDFERRLSWAATAAQSLRNYNQVMAQSPMSHHGG